MKLSANEKARLGLEDEEDEQLIPAFRSALRAGDPRAIRRKWATRVSIGDGQKRPSRPEP